MDQKLQPKVSIIMPVYNTEKYIVKSIESAINQTYKNIELLCINDGTKDNAFEICKRFAQQHSHIVLVDYGCNKGLEAARNAGIDTATGDYLMYLDSDDTIDVHMIEEMVAKSGNADIVMCTYAMVVEGQEKPVLAPASVPEKMMDTTEFCSYMLSDFSWSLLSCVGTKLYKKNHIRFDRKYKYNEDGGYFLEGLDFAETITFVNKPYYKYFIRQAGSIMSSYRPGMFQSVKIVNELLKSLLMKNGMFEKRQQFYYRKLYYLMLDSLYNEARFGSKATFKQQLQIIRDYPDIDNMFSSMNQAHLLGGYHQLIYRIFQRKHDRLLYLCLKVKARK